MLPELPALLCDDAYRHRAGRQVSVQHCKRLSPVPVNIRLYLLLRRLETAGRVLIHSGLFHIHFISFKTYHMKKIFLLAATAMLMSGAVALANGEKKDKTKDKKACTEKCCTKACPKPCPPVSCDKSKCEKVKP